MTQWLRKITVQYGQDIEGSTYGPLNGWTVTSESDNDLRMAFRFVRTNTNRADTGVLLIYNLPTAFRDSIDSGLQESNDDRANILVDPRFINDIDLRNAELRELAEANLVLIYAGYRDDTKLIFRGDITDLKVRMLSSDVDTVTSITLGDAIIPLKFGYLQKSFGPGTNLVDMVGTVVSSAGIPPSPQGADFLKTASPGVVEARLEYGHVVLGGVQANVDAIVAALGVQWFVKDGESYFMSRGAVLSDFSLGLDEGENVLRPVGKLNGNDIQFTMLLDGHMHPGRGFRIFDTTGSPTSTFGYRADTVEYRGDTHGKPWYCIVRGRRIPDDPGKFPPPFFPITPDQAFAAAGPDT